MAEQIRTYDYKDYDFELPISNPKRKVLEYKGNFKVPEEVTLAQDLVIFGNLEILPFAKILGDIKVYGNIKVWNNVKISGGIYASGKITLMDNCIVGKDIISANKIEIYPGCRLNIFSGRIATYKNIILDKKICIFGSIISPVKVK
jgi:cytoskeletal protein CcmA (bactofilin family)